INASVLSLKVGQRYPSRVRPAPEARHPSSLHDAMPPPFVVLITGASSGIGEAAARRLAREPGAKLILVARREERLQALADSLGGATVIAQDVTAADAPARIAEVVQLEHGALDLLVNNAGAAW